MVWAIFNVEDLRTIFVAFRRFLFPFHGKTLEATKTVDYKISLNKGRNLPVNKDVNKHEDNGSDEHDHYKQQKSDQEVHYRRHQVEGANKVLDAIEKVFEDHCKAIP